MIDEDAKDGYVRGNSEEDHDSIPACKHRQITNQHAFYVRGIELRGLALTYLAIRSVTDDEEHGLPPWEGTGRDESVMNAKLLAAGVTGWPVCPPVKVPLYRRSATLAFEIFAVMAVGQILHTSFLAETLVGDYKLWYSGRVATQKAAPDSSPYASCMIGEFLLLHQPVPVERNPQHVLGMPTGIAALIIRKRQEAGAAEEVARNEGGGGDKATKARRKGSRATLEVKRRRGNAKATPDLATATHASRVGDMR